MIGAVTRKPTGKAPPDVSVSLSRGAMTIGERDPGTSREQQFVREIQKQLGIDPSDLDRELEEFLDELTVVECVAIAEAVWGVELGPRSGTVSEIAGLAYEWPTLRALIDAAESKIHD